MAIKVSLRQKAISKKRQSLYLDFYPAIPHPETGKPTRREFLGMYLFDTNKNPVDKQHNKETYQLAEQIRQKKENFLNKPEIYSEYEKEQLKKKEQNEYNFLNYFQQLIDKRNGSNADNWTAALKYLKVFSTDTLKVGDLNERFCNEFKEHLLNTYSLKRQNKRLAQNTALSYFNKFKAALKQAYKDDVLSFDLNSKVSPIKEAETKKEFLNLEEVNLLVKTPCKNEQLKRAALFSILTGLRFSDIKNLSWDEIEFIQDHGYIIKFQQQKTKGIETLPISEQAYQLLGEQGNAAELLFKGLSYSAMISKELKQWTTAAGIDKKITFHCFRHTYATLQLFNGTDLYTVSKMLGHKSLKTTQVYAKIVDATKRAATNNIILDL
jgi:integrase